jgi:hypothetical protein
MRRAREPSAPGLRSFPFGRYVIFYVPLDDGIDVVRVLHAAREIDAQFDRPGDRTPGQRNASGVIYVGARRQTLAPIDRPVADFQTYRKQSFRVQAKAVTQSERPQEESREVIAHGSIFIAAAGAARGPRFDQVRN